MRELKNVTLSGETHVERVENTVKNVIGVLDGEGPHADETIVIGAHYDHLGAAITAVWRSAPKKFITAPTTTPAGPPC
ncbi:MAG: hypothetical protein QM811_14630 [Pirellulales bacterium]